MSSSTAWSAKVEYQVDKTESVISCNWIKDLSDECPAFDPHKTYRAFWSPVSADTPDLMLKRVPEIPILTESDEKLTKAGYYRICILGIEDDPNKFELSRVRRQTNRGKTNNGDNAKKVPLKKNTKGNGSGSGSKKEAAASKTESDKYKQQANKANLKQATMSSRPFDKLDEDTKHDFGDSDDSEEDVTLVSDKTVKVLTLSVKNLKSKLLEKCEEIGRLEKIIAKIKNFRS